jgi:hypothetical protein
VIVKELVASALDSGASEIRLTVNKLLFLP